MIIYLFDLKLNQSLLIFVLRVIEIIMTKHFSIDNHKKYNQGKQTVTKAFYSVEKLLKQTVKLTRCTSFDKKHQSQKQQVQTKYLPSIVNRMNRNKLDLEKSLENNHHKLNLSYSQYFKNQVNVNKDLLRKKKVTKYKNVENKRQKTVEPLPIERDQPGFIETSLKLSPLPNHCYDSIFPSIRYNATLFGMDKQVYLLGGYHLQRLQGLPLFHKYDLQGNKWLQMNGQGEVPKISPCYHTVQTYKNNLIIVGGVSLQGEKGKRFNSQILIYNFQRNQWIRSRCGIIVKNHASTLFGATLMVSGGINQKQKFNEDIYFVSFNGGNVVNPLVFTTHNHSDARVSGHKIINTYEVDLSIRTKIKYDGVFSFGGQGQNGIMNNDILYMNVMGKNNQALDIKFKKWLNITINEERPCPRKNHSFNIINKKGVAILAGGIEQNGSWLHDVWMLDFTRWCWTKVSTLPSIQQSIGSLTGHCACSIGTVVYFYNGNVQKKREKAFWMLQTDPATYKSKKTFYNSKLPSFKSITSQKQKQNCSMMDLI